MELQIMFTLSYFDIILKNLRPLLKSKASLRFGMQLQAEQEIVEQKKLKKKKK